MRNFRKELKLQRKIDDFQNYKKETEADILFSRW